MLDFSPLTFQKRHFLMVTPIPLPETSDPSKIQYYFMKAPHQTTSFADFIGLNLKWGKKPLKFKRFKWKSLFFFPKCTNLSLQPEQNRTAASFAQELNRNSDTQRTCWEEQKSLWRLCLCGLNSHFKPCPTVPGCPELWGGQTVPSSSAAWERRGRLINTFKYILNFQCLLMTCREGPNSV